MNLNELTQQMEENNRSNYEIERHTRNARAHLLEIKKTMFASVEIQANMLGAINGLVEVLKGNALAQLEKDREMMRLLEGLGGKDDGPSKPDEFVPDTSIGLLLAGAAAAIGAAAGALIGWAKAIKAYVSLFTPKSFDDIAKGISTKWTNAVNGIKTSVAAKLETLKLNIGTWLDDFKAKFTIDPESPFGKAIARVKAIISNIGGKFSTVADDMAIVATRIAEKIQPMVTKVKNFAFNIGVKMKTFGSVIGRVATLVGKVFAPIAIITTAWETITGALDGFAEDGILGGLEGAIDGFFTSLITMPLDLVKDAVAWVAKKFGFDETAETLTSFSFTALFDKMTDKIFDFLRSGWDWVVGKVAFTKELFAEFSISDLLTEAVTSVKNFVMEMFDNVVNSITSFDPMAVIGNLANMGEEFIKKILRAVLPPADFGIVQLPEADLGILGKYGGGSINLNPIPDSVYEFANAPAPEAADPPITGAAMGAAQGDIADAQAGGAVVQQIIQTTNQVGGDSVTIAPGNPGTRREADGQLDDLVFSP